jgi:hypothetical protein
MSKYFKGWAMGVAFAIVAGFVSAILKDVLGKPHEMEVFFFAGGMTVYLYCRFIDRKPPIVVKPYQLYHEASQPMVCTFEMTLDDAKRFGHDFGKMYLLESYEWTLIPGGGRMGLCKVYLVPNNGILEVTEK